MFLRGWFQKEFVTLKLYCLTRSRSLPPLSLDVWASEIKDCPRRRVKVDAALEVALKSPKTHSLEFFQKTFLVEI